MEFEDEPMDINETETDYFEEGEINSSGDETNTPVHMPSSVSSIFVRNSHTEKTDEFVTGLNIFDQNETQKKLDRAKRFSLPLQIADSAEFEKEKLVDLYRDLRIDKENERHYRFNAIHMRGTENMSTDDVLQYFIAYAPSHVEWINDVSCNVVWTDDVSAARALLNLSKKIKNLEKIHLNADPFEKDFKNQKFEPIDNDEAVDAREIKTAIPPGFWRIGVPCDKSSFLLMRYATRSDKKQKNSEKNSEYYRKYGNPHFGNIPGLISSSLRTEIKKSKFKTPDFISRRYMGSGPEKSNPWEELAYEWGKTDKVEQPDHNFIRNTNNRRDNSIPDLRISLKNREERHKRIRKASEVSLTSDREPWERRSKIPRMKMYADVEEEKLEKNFEKKFHSNQFKRKPEEDLRSKINRKKNETRFKFRSEKKSPVRFSKESSDSENDYDDGDSTEWALEHYHDLRESLQQSKKQEHKSYNSVKYESDSDHDKDNSDNEEDGDDDDDDIDVDIYERDLSRRSPLQIEIKNDEYYLNKEQKAK